MEVTGSTGELTDGVGGTPCSWSVDAGGASQTTLVTSYVSLGTGWVKVYDTNDTSASPVHTFSSGGGSLGSSPVVIQLPSVFVIEYEGNPAGKLDWRSIKVCVCHSCVAT